MNNWEKLFNAISIICRNILKKEPYLTKCDGIIRSINNNMATVMINGENYNNIPISTLETLKVNDVVFIEYINNDFSHKWIARKRPW